SHLLPMWHRHSCLFPDSVTQLYSRNRRHSRLRTIGFFARHSPALLPRKKDTRKHGLIIQLVKELLRLFTPFRTLSFPNMPAGPTLGFWWLPHQMTRNSERFSLFPVLPAPRCPSQRMPHLVRRLLM